MRRLLTACVLLAAAALPGCAPLGPTADVPVPSGRPCTAVVVDAPVSDGFRPPAQPWLPGNRGVTFATRPGQVVHAALSGTVVFAGPIGGARYVSVLHTGGFRTTYSFLATVAVRAGQIVAAGTVVGITSQTPFQLGELLGDRYVDPTVLLGQACATGRAVLVPVPTG